MRIFLAQTGPTDSQPRYRDKILVVMAPTHAFWSARYSLTALKRFQTEKPPIVRDSRLLGAGVKCCDVGKATLASVGRTGKREQQSAMWASLLRKVEECMASCDYLGKTMDCDEGK